MIQEYETIKTYCLECDKEFDRDLILCPECEEQLKDIEEPIGNPIDEHVYYGVNLADFV